MSSPDKHGPLELPATGTTRPAGDPVIGKLSTLIAAHLNGMIAELWTAPGVAPNKAPVVRAYTHNPDNEEFNTNGLPGVFVWRSGAARAPYQLAADYRVREERVEIVWVFQVGTQAKQAAREPISNAIAAAIDGVCAQNRSRFWVDDGDTDPLAASIGSNVRVRVGVLDIKPLPWEPSRVQVDVQGGAPLKFACGRFPVMVQERVIFGADGAGAVPLSKVDGDGGIVEKLILQHADEDPDVLVFNESEQPTP